MILLAYTRHLGNQEIIGQSVAANRRLITLRLPRVRCYVCYIIARCQAMVELSSGFRGRKCRQVVQMSDNPFGPSLLHVHLKHIIKATSSDLDITIKVVTGSVIIYNKGTAYQRLYA